MFLLFAIYNQRVFRKHPPHACAHAADLDARDDGLFLPRLNAQVRNPTGATLPPVIPNVE